MTPVSDVKLLAPATLTRLWHDLAWISVHFSFNTDRVCASGVANLVKTTDGIKVWTLYTVIEGLRDFPEHPSHHGHEVGGLSWGAQRERDACYDDQEPDVVIIGGGHK